jgi:hypothetical protein
MLPPDPDRFYRVPTINKVTQFRLSPKSTGEPPKHTVQREEIGAVTLEEPWSTRSSVTTDPFTRRPRGAKGPTLLLVHDGGLPNPRKKNKRSSHGWGGEEEAQGEAAEEGGAGRCPRAAAGGRTWPEPGRRTAERRAVPRPVRAERRPVRAACTRGKVAMCYSFSSHGNKEIREGQ